MSRSKEEWEESRKAQAEALHAAWGEQNDWWGVCRRCGIRLSGTPKDLQAHVCQEKKP